MCHALYINQFYMRTGQRARRRRRVCKIAFERTKEAATLLSPWGFLSVAAARFKEIYLVGEGENGNQLLQHQNVFRVYLKAWGKSQPPAKTIFLSATVP